MLLLPAVLRIFSCLPQLLREVVCIRHLHSFGFTIFLHLLLFPQFSWKDPPPLMVPHELLCMTKAKDLPLLLGSRCHVSSWLTSSFVHLCTPLASVTADSPFPHCLSLSLPSCMVSPWVPSSFS